MRYQAAMDAVLERLRKDLPRNLYYHSIDHTLDVLDRVTSLAAAEHVGEQDMILLRVAACYHDSGFLINNRDHERLGCKLVRRELPDFGFSDKAIQIICGMIRSTKIPQSPRDHLQRIICDADLDYLGRDDFYTIGRRLFRELKAYRLLGTEAEWNRLQIKFLRQHQYWTQTNVSLRRPKKLERLRELVAEWGEEEIK